MKKFRNEKFMEMLINQVQITHNLYLKKTTLVTAFPCLFFGFNVTGSSLPTIK